MFESLHIVPRSELERRWALCRSLLAETAPGAGGLLAFSRVSVYYLSGTLAMGLVWLPAEGEPVLMVRKGVERGRLESEIKNVAPYRSYKDLPELAASFGSPFPEAVAVETAGLSWQMGQMLAGRVSGVRFVSGDAALAMAQAFKSDYELSILRLAGERHHRALHDILPGRIRPGMTERELSHLAWEVFFSLGHQGHMRMSAFGEEIFLGHVSAGDSGNYPSSFNGPLGLRGEHPAAPVMGYAGTVWGPCMPLAMDVGFVLEGYHTDKTQVYWSGPASTIPDQVASAHAFCVDVQAWTAEHARPGTLPSEIWRHCSEWAVKAGFGEGFMGLGENKVPFLGHGIGLTIDGWPALAKGFDRPLQAGMVLAVEPKHGLPGIGMVGVENTFEVVADGPARCLTGDEFGIVCVE